MEGPLEANKNGPESSGPYQTNFAAPNRAARGYFFFFGAAFFFAGALAAFLVAFFIV
ncbi:MAG: hypothetical protein HY822_20490 [Acidobacteria bacterium]|nr:hypothetical protein [Acidobacteriota bacterium]